MPRRGWDVFDQLLVVEVKLSNPLGPKMLQFGPPGASSSMLPIITDLLVYEEAQEGHMQVFG